MEARPSLQTFGSWQEAFRANERGMRRRTWFMLVLLGLVGGLPATLWLAGYASDWRHPVLLVGLELLAICAIAGEVIFNRVALFGLVDSVIVVAVALCGPIPAFLVMLCPDLLLRLRTSRLPMWTPGSWASYASYAWSALAAAAVLTLAHAGGASGRNAPAVFSAGIVWTFVNWTLARALPARLWSGQRVWPLFRGEYLTLLPAQICMLAFAALLVALMPLIGEAGVLALLAPLVLGAQTVLPWLARSGDISKRDPAAATAIYVRALAGHLRLPRAQRRIALALVKLERGATVALCGAPRSERGWLLDCCSAPLPPAPVGLRTSAAEAHEVWLAALHRWEHWDGGGAPSGARGEEIPLASRVVAVAAEWALLTAAGGPKLSQAEAALALEAESGTRFDPALVRAAGEIIATEAQFADIETFEPRLDLLPLPATIRHELLPRALRAYAAV